MDEVEPLEFSEDGLEISGQERSGKPHGKMQILLDGQKISLNFKDGLLDGPGIIDAVGKMNFSQDKLINIQLNNGHSLDFSENKSK